MFSLCESFYLCLSANLIQTTDKKDRLIFARGVDEWFEKRMLYMFLAEMQRVGIMQDVVEKHFKKEMYDKACQFVNGSVREKQKIFDELI